MAREKKYDLHEATPILSQLLDAVLAGERVVLRRAEDGAEIELVPRPRKREPGRYKGRISFAPDTFAPTGEADYAERKEG